MVPLHKRWHFATKRAPEKDARILWFAATPNPDGSPNPEEEKAENTNAEAGEIPAMTAPGEAINERKNATTDALKATLEKKDEETQKEKTKDAAEDPNALQKREVMRQKFRDVIAQASANSVKIHELKLRMENKKIMKRLESSGNAGLISQWKEDLRLLNQENFNTTKEKEFAEAVLSFWEGEMAPKEFLANNGEYLSTLPYGFDRLGKSINASGKPKGLDEAIRIDLDARTTLGDPAFPIDDPRAFQSTQAGGFDKDQWATVNQGTRLETIQTLLDHVQIDSWMAGKKAQYEALEKALKQEEGFISNVEKQANGIETAEDAEKTNPRGIGAALKQIRWLSINDYMNGMGKYWNALKSTWETRGDRASAAVAKQIGAALEPFNMFPLYGAEVNTILGQQLDAKESEEEEAMKNMLSGNHYSWEQVFGEGGEFQKWSRTNPNKARGCLAWAAEKGFLYDIDENLDDSKHPIYGIPIADICSDWASDPRKITNYFTVLRGKNSAGREHEMDHGYKMEFDVENVPRFIRLVEHEMHDRNLWAAAGVCKRAMERGLKGEVASWLFTTIMSELRHYPDLRKVTPVAFFDIIGKLSMYQTAFTMGWAKGLRPQLRQWAISGDEEILKKTPLKHFSVVEQDILAKDPSIDRNTNEGRQRLNELVAQVFSAHIVKLPNGYVNIYETRFQPYRADVLKYFAATAKPTDEDSDFATEDTEKGMLPEVVLKKILKYNSTFEFSAEDWVQGYFGSLISMAERMKKIPELSDAHKNYCNELRAKMDAFFGSYKHKGDAVKQLSTKDGFTGKPAIASLVASNLLSWNVMRDAAYAPALREQLKEHFYPQYVDLVLNDPKGNTELNQPAKKKEE